MKAPEHVLNGPCGETVVSTAVSEAKNNFQFNKKMYYLLRSKINRLSLVSIFLPALTVCVSVGVPMGE